MHSYGHKSWELTQFTLLKGDFYDDKSLACNLQSSGDVGIFKSTNYYIIIVTVRSRNRGLWLLLLFTAPTIIMNSLLPFYYYSSKYILRGWMSIGTSTSFVLADACKLVLANIILLCHHFGFLCTNMQRISAIKFETKITVFFCNAALQKKALRKIR